MTGDFIEITTNSTHEYITSKMPASGSIVEVKLRDGTTRLAWYDSDIMEAGDFDFLPIEDGKTEPDIGRDSIADQVIAWRPHP